jgi:integrase/recombinase XerD
MTLDKAIRLFLDALRAQAFARRTIATYAPLLEAFVDWAARQGVESTREVDQGLLRDYQAAVAATISRYGRPLSISAQSQRLTVLRLLFAFLVRRQLLIADPARELELPRVPRRGLPYGLPTPAEMERLLSAPDVSTPLGIRLRAMMEVLYATGIRNAELRALRIWDVDLNEGTLTVVRGKGQKDRVVPLGAHACHWVGVYLARVRPLWAKGTNSILFVTQTGRRIHYVPLSRFIRDCARKAGLTKRITAHTLRHACASHMLRAGAGIRHLQRLLGHRSLATTEVYTHVEISDLKRVHRKCHPRAGGRRRRGASKRRD